ncbi:hypothetical protein ASC80_02635 [Afipia sp. Root123D2]|uniref:NAD-dependent epimerase/dehydratase family protein n=1 Tax=Afipia sp. Root123D2 TaxID=1736436 RepID=UPI0007013061|nr:NAD(P)-dependent oxidoreductase [Afipia sp. Root123D2]KQW22309.1 hypothetical protein ASC80_02635 [Afipia sp. Root123D2]
MTIVVTGAGGFVGKRLVSLLADASYDVFALVHSMPSDEDRHYFSNKRITVREVDLLTFDPSSLPQGVTGVISLAQSAYFRDFPERSKEVFQVNVVANLQLLDWAVRSGVKRFVLASSGGIYGGKRGVQFQETDDFQTNSPLGFYLGSKFCSEIILQNYRQLFDCAVTVRPFFIYGPGQRSDMFIARIINSVRDGRPITLQGPDGLRVNPVYVDDAAVAFARALEVNGNKTINVAGPDVLSLRSVAEGAGLHLGRPPLFEAVQGEPVDYVADITIARQVLKLEPRPFAVGLTETLGSK